MEIIFPFLSFDFFFELKDGSNVCLFYQTKIDLDQAMKHACAFKLPGAGKLYVTYVVY